MEEEKDKKIADAIKLMYSFLPNKPKYIRDVLVTDIFAWLDEKLEKTTEYGSNNRRMDSSGHSQ